MEMIDAKDAGRITTVVLRVPTEHQMCQIVDLYRAQGWWQTADGEGQHFVSKLIAGSHCFVAAVKGEDIIGMGRAISDGISDAYIQDLTVRSDCRNQGIGTRILHVLLNRLHDDGLHWIGLIAEPGSDNLYRRAGFRDMSPWIPMLMTSRP